ncbi:MAG TPA: zinc-binding dehydrogenase [Streptosporangiaceae bacterium]
MKGRGVVRVIEVPRFGGPEVLAVGEVPDLVARPGQAVVRVSAADVLFVDTIIRHGLGVDFFAIRPPYVPGNGVVGRVISTGDGVDSAWIGSAVVAHTGESGGWGGYAEQAAVPAENLIAVPDGLAPPDAVALLHDGATAMGLLERIGVKPGEWVLVTAAAGGMGIVLVQLARAAGGRVIGAARGEHKLAAVRVVGAEAVVDYSTEDWTDRVRALTDGRGVDVVFDGAVGRLGAAAFDVTADGGRFSAHGLSAGGFAGIGPEAAARRGVTVSGIEQGPFSPADFKRLATQALHEAATGRIRPLIGQTFPLDQAPAAHAALEARSTIGKTLLLT